MTRTRGLLYAKRWNAHPYVFSRESTLRHAVYVAPTGAGKTGHTVATALSIKRTWPEVNVCLCDMKGDLARHAEQLLATGAVPGLQPHMVAKYAPFRGVTLPSNPCAKMEGLEPAIQATYVIGLLGALLKDNWGVRMEAAALPLIEVAIEGRGTLRDVADLLIREDARAVWARRMDFMRPDLAAHLREGVDSAPAASREAVRARIDLLLRSTLVRTPALAQGSLDGAMFLEHPFSIIDFGDAPGEVHQRFVAGLVHRAIMNHALHRDVRQHPNPVVMLADEYQELARATVDDMARFLALARSRRVYVHAIFQGFSAIREVSSSLVDCMLTNCHLRTYLAPSPSDVAEIVEQVPLRGNIVSPSTPDRLVTNERAYLREKLAGLRHREGIVIDSWAKTADFITTLSVPLDEAERRYERLPEEVREAWRFGAFAVRPQDLEPAQPTDEAPERASEARTDTEPAPAKARPPRRRGKPPMVLM